MNKYSRRHFLTSVAAAGACLSLPAWAGPFNRARVGDAPIFIERDFVSVGYGQLHFRMARPSDPAKIAHRPVVCFHQTPISSQIYIEFMSTLAQDRIVYAVDTPGLGESDLPANPPEISDYAQSMFEFLEAKSLQDIDVVGYHTGASISVELALLTGDQIKHMMLAGIALFNEEERQGFFASPWPKPREEDGSHVMVEWERSQFWRGPGQTDDSVSRTFTEKLVAGETAWWTAGAVMRHDLESALLKLQTPALIINSKDDLYPITPRISEIRPDLEVITFDEVGFGIFEVQPKIMADLARGFFDQ